MLVSKGHTEREREREKGQKRKQGDPIDRSPNQRYVPTQEGGRHNGNKKIAARKRLIYPLRRTRKIKR